MLPLSRAKGAENSSPLYLKSFSELPMYLHVMAETFAQRPSSQQISQRFAKIPARARRPLQRQLMGVSALEISNRRKPNAQIRYRASVSRPDVPAYRCRGRKPGSSPSFPPKWLVDFILGVEAGKSDIAEHSFIEPSKLEPTVFAPAPFTQRRTHPPQKAAQPAGRCLPLRLLWDPIGIAGRRLQQFGSRLQSPPRTTPLAR